MLKKVDGFDYNFKNSVTRNKRHADILVKSKSCSLKNVWSLLFFHPLFSLTNSDFSTILAKLWMGKFSHRTEYWQQLHVPLNMTHKTNERYLELMALFIKPKPEHVF